MRGAVEKPSREEVESNLAMFRCSPLLTNVIRILSETRLGKSNEFWLTDAAPKYIRREGHVVAQPATDGE
ncbi:MAG: hypothetical protein ACREA2_18165 [Blastocatellia bacterium]